MNKSSRIDFAPWVLLPSILLTLSSVTLLAPHLTAQAAAATVRQTPAPKALTTGDEEGDELLEHWGDPQYSHEEQKQMAGIAFGFLVLGGFAYRRRSQKKVLGELVHLPTEADFLKLDKRKAA